MIYQNLPYTPVWVKKSFLTGPENFCWGEDEMVEAVLVGIKAVFNCAPLYEIYIPEYGACYDKTLQCAIFDRPESPKEEITLMDVAWWDCISPFIQVYEKRMFKNVAVKMQNKRKHWFNGTYLWTVDFLPPHSNRGVDLSEAYMWSEHKQKNFFFDDLKNLNINACIVNARFVKPLDKNLIMPLVSRIQKVVTMEEGTLIGGFGSAIVELLNDNEVNIPVYRIGIPDVLVDHASPDQSKEKLGLMPDQMADKIVKKFKLNN